MGKHLCTIDGLLVAKISSVFPLRVGKVTIWANPASQKVSNNKVNQSGISYNFVEYFIIYNNNLPR